jgi:beta-ribofuranosylaminobenzene 5'-phosphate synthase
MIRVRAPSRLHFGLLSVAAADAPWPDRLGQPTVPSRQFGGVGLMIESPGIHLSMRAAPAWSAEGPLAERALGFARHFAEQIQAERQGDFPPQHLLIEQAAPEHAGLGTGTQLGLAVGRALAEAWGLHLDVPTLARLVGFLVEAGKRDPEALSPLVFRMPFPETWRIVLVIPSGLQGVSGKSEAEAFAHLSGAGNLQTDALCRLTLLGLVPALIEADWRAFSEALYDFNARAGEAFARVQEGVYSHALVAEVVAFVRRQGIPGTGQSSWGPTVFAIVPDQERARDLSDRIRARFTLEQTEVVVTRAWNRETAT